MKVFLILLFLFGQVAVAADAVDPTFLAMYKDACAKGGNVGCNELGVIEANKNILGSARELFEKACAGGAYPNGCNNLGAVESRLGHKGDAKRLFKMSCDNKDSDGCYRLGITELDLGNYAQARIQFNKACDAGKNEACDELTKLARHGK